MNTSYLNRIPPVKHIFSDGMLEKHNLPKYKTFCSNIFLLKPARNRVSLAHLE